MTEKAKSKKSPKKVRATEKSPVEVNRRREWRFELPLPAEIEGHMPEGKKFALFWKIFPRPVLIFLSTPTWSSVQKST